MRRSHVKKRGDEFVRLFVTNYLAPRKRESISYLVQHIRENNIYFPTGNNDAASEFERLGFLLKMDRNEFGSIMRTYVHLKPASEIWGGR